MTNNIRIGFSSPTTKFVPFAWAVQAIEKRPYDHVYVRIQEPLNGQWMIFQASKEMVNMYSISWFLNSNEVIKEYEIPCTNDQYKDLWQFAMDNLGVPYSTKQIIGILFRKLFRMNQIFPNGTSGEICAELAARVCIMLGFTPKEDLDIITPSDLDYFLESCGVICILNPSLPL